MICDSINPAGSRLTTMELSYPRCVHAEFMTHRMFSRNSASSRAIPVEKMLQRIKDDPFVPIHWGVNQKGMQANEEIDSYSQYEATAKWLLARDNAVKIAEELNALGLHKQIVNRIVEPWMWITVIVTGVDHAWENFFALRCHPAAEPHIQKLAYQAREVYDSSKPMSLQWGVKHLPFVYGNDMVELLGWCRWEKDIPHDECAAALAKISVGRCARVSYLTHDGKRDPQADIDLHDRLVTAKPPHASPFEHVATAYEGSDVGGNFGQGWFQYRKQIEGEYTRKSGR